MKRITMHKARQQGLALLVAMIVLVVMSLAAVGLIRSTDTGVLLAGNLAFRQSAMHANDTGIETARTWLMAATPAAREASSSANGYYAADDPTLDMTGNDPARPTKLNWDAAGGRVRCLAATANGNTVCYVIHRLCLNTGALNAATCAVVKAPSGSNTKGGLIQNIGYNPAFVASITTNGYYRVTVRVAGPRNNVSYTQAYLII